MDIDKLILDKIEINKVKRSDDKSNMPKNEPRKFKSKLSIEDKLSKDQNPIDMPLKTNKNVARIPKSVIMAGDGYQQTNRDGDFKITKTYTLSTIFSEDEKCESDYLTFGLNGTESTSHTIDTSISSQSSFGFFESGSSVQDYQYKNNKLNEEYNVSLKEGDTESDKTLPNNSDETLYIESVHKRRGSQKGNSSIPHHFYDKMNVRDSVGVKRSVVKNRHEDVKLDSSENVGEIQDNTLLLCEEQDQIKELKDAFEKSTNCLVKCLESFHNKSQKQKKLSLCEDYSTAKSDKDAFEKSTNCLVKSLENFHNKSQKQKKLSFGEDYSTTKSDKDAIEKSTNCLVKSLENFHNKSQKQKKLSLGEDYSTAKSDTYASERKSYKKDFKTFDLKRDADKSDTSLSTSYSSENNSATKVKQRIYTDTCLIHVDSPKSIFTETTKSKNCSCDCCNGRCLHFPKSKDCPCRCCTEKCLHSQNTRRNRTGDLVQGGKMPKEKKSSRVSIGHFSHNKTTTNAILEQPRSRSKYRRRCHPPPSDMPISVRKIGDSIENKNASSSQVNTLNDRECQSFENWLTSPEESSRIKNGKNEKNCIKRKNKSKLIENFQQNGQTETHEEENEVQEDKKVDHDPNNILLLTYLFVISALLCFTFYIFIFI